jgi:hypothetical protein
MKGTGGFGTLTSLWFPNRHVKVRDLKRLTVARQIAKILYYF